MIIDLFYEDFQNFQKSGRNPDFCIFLKIGFFRRKFDVRLFYLDLYFEHAE